MSNLFRIAVFAAAFFAVVALGMGIYYYQFARPTWMDPQAEISRKLQVILNDPSTCIECIKQAATDARNVALQAFHFLDSAVDLLLTMTAIAAAWLGYIAYCLRVRKESNGSAL